MSLINLRNKDRRTVTYSDKKQSAWLPSSCKIGYGKFKASPGDLITFNVGATESEPDYRHGRVIGVITKTDRDGEGGTGKLLVLMLGNTYTFAHEGWVDVADVKECASPERAAAFTTWFMSAPPSEMAEYMREMGPTASKVYDLTNAQKPKVE